jgi:prolyl 4-hydroxylase
MHLVFKINNPFIAVIGDLLTRDECDKIIQMASGRLQVSTTVNMENGENEVHRGRVCAGMHFNKGENDFILDIEKRLSEVTGFRREQFENLQVVKYGAGEFYRPHFDFFDPDHGGTENLLKRGGQRIATIVVYLQAPNEGGETFFSAMNLTIFPIVGCGLYFKYPLLEKTTLHGGNEVVKGEKWILTSWIRENKFI